MKKRILLAVLTGIAISATSFSCCAGKAADKSLKVVIIRHGEKPEAGDNLSCQGENRALKLPAVLYQKFNKPDHTYIPALGLGKETSHARMFQTVTPFAAKYNLTINSKYGGNDYEDIAKSVLEKKGTVLMVWEHSAIPPLAKSLGVKNPPDWNDEDFDSIWIINYANGKAEMSMDKEEINPSSECDF